MKSLHKFIIGFHWKDSDGNWNSCYDATDTTPFAWLSAFASSKGLDIERLCFEFIVNYDCQ